MARRDTAPFLLSASIALAACSGGGGGGSAPPPAVTPPATPGAPVTVSGASPFPAGCGGTGGTVYVNAEVEPSLAANPANPAHLLAMWQQDRWSNGSARGLVSAVSLDGGATWSSRPMAFSRCGGGTAANGGDFERATDPWVAFGPDGSAWAMSLSTAGSAANAMLVARSLDGGRTWGNATALIADADPFFNDKNALTADPFDARYAYAVWDRLTGQGTGPAMLARTVDGGASWEPARVLYDPGTASQTIGNLVVVLTDGTLVNLATRLGTRADAPRDGAIVALRSGDRGASWGPPVTVASQLSVGARDPDTGAVIRDGSILLAAAAGPGRSVHVVWQDARFSGGVRDGIAYSRSSDGGLTWSAPVRVNPNGGVDAFTPGVSVLADGTVGVTYYDLRDNTADLATLPAGYWLARSADGSTWTESRLAGPFDLALAPNAGGLFLGDYMGLAGSGSAFLSLFGRTTGDLANRTEIAFVRTPAAAAALDKATGAWPERWIAPQAAPFEVDAGWAWRVDAAIGRALEARRRPAPR